MDLIIPISQTIILGYFIWGIHDFGIKYLDIKRRGTVLFENIIHNNQNNDDDNTIDDSEDENDNTIADVTHTINHRQIIRNAIEAYINNIDMKMNNDKPSCINIPDDCNIIDVPNEYKCPITKELMKDPVIASDGRTYEREMIEHHMRITKYSPITREEFLFPYLIPNWNIRVAIQDYINSRINNVVN